MTDRGSFTWHSPFPSTRWKRGKRGCAPEGSRSWRRRNGSGVGRASISAIPTSTWLSWRRRVYGRTTEGRSEPGVSARLLAGAASPALRLLRRDFLGLGGLVGARVEDGGQLAAQLPLVEVPLQLSLVGD